MTTNRYRPDPSKGIFETMLVVRGAPVALDAHLSRLRTSVEALYEGDLPAQVRKLVVEHAAGLELGRLRLTVAPAVGNERLAPRVEASELDRSLHFPERALTLRPHPVPGGLGTHKWVDRAAIPPGSKEEAPLLIDRGEVLEAGWANVFAVRGGTLFTPPLDGRILPGVTRATVIELARGRGIEVIESALTLTELQEAEGVFLTNSIRGIERVHSIERAPLASEDRLARSLEIDLRKHWSLSRADPRRSSPESEPAAP